MKIEIQTMKIVVVDYKTKIPIVNANIELLGEYFTVDPCWCSSYQVLLTRQTNANGSFLFNQSDFAKASLVVIMKEGYLRISYPLRDSGPRDTLIEFDRTANINLHLIQISSYPDDASIIISNTSEHSTSADELWIQTLSKNENYPFKGFANQMNTFTWVVRNKFSKEIYAKGTVHKELLEDAITDVEIQY